jgi:predicted metal-dependent RNase
LPCFGLGRGQEVLEILLKARRNGELDPSVVIWVDGLVRKILPIYVERGKVDPDGYELVGLGERERQFAIDSCRHPDSRAVVVTTSGMLNGGPILKWADALLRHPQHGIALLGYQDEGSSAGGALRKLTETKSPPYVLRVRGEDGDEVQVKIEMKPGSIGLSAHADEDGLVDFARSISARHIALVHGEPRAQEALENRLIRELPGIPISRSGGEMLRIA